MTPKQLTGVQGRLGEFLEDLVEPIGRSERRHWAGVYVQGVLLDGERKSVQPMAARLAGAESIPESKSVGGDGDSTAAGATAE